MELPPPEPSKTWRTSGGDLSDDEWDLIADLLDPPTRSKMGRPRKHSRRSIADAIFYVAATGCQWRNLPDKYPPWSTVHHYHVTWSRDGTWERVCDRLRNLVRLSEGREAEPSAGIIDARTVRGASTVTTTHARHSDMTRGYDGGKRISGRKLFGLVDTIGLLVGVRVVAAGVSDNAGGIMVFDLARPRPIGSGGSGSTPASKRRSPPTSALVVLRSRWSTRSIRPGSTCSLAAGSWNEPGHGS